MSSASNAAVCCDTPGPTDSISKLAWSKVDSNFIATSNWDGKVRVYRQHDSGSFVHVAAAATHPNMPALCVDWHSDGASLFTCGGDNAAVQCRLEGAAITHAPVAKHSAPIKSLTWWAEASLLVTGGFDNTMMYWDLRQSQPVHAMACPGKVQCVASKGPTMVMTCLNNAVGDLTCKSAVYAFDKSNWGANIRSVVADAERSKLFRGQTFTPTHASPVCLNYQIRSIGMMRNGEGWALSGSEGRVVVENRADANVPADWPQLDVLFSSMAPKPRGPVQHAMTANFNFRCHRIEKKENGKTISYAYPVNGVAFNNRHNTMATCGSEGAYVFWDKDNRQKLKSHPEPAGASLGNSIIDIDFSPDSNFIAYVVAYDWAKGKEGKTDASEGLYVRRVADADIAPKKK